MSPHQISPRSGGRISSSVSHGIDGISAGLGTAEVIGIVGAIILTVVILVLVCVIHSKKQKKGHSKENDGSYGQGEMRRDQMYEWHRSRAREASDPVPATPGARGPEKGDEETVNLLPARPQTVPVRR